MSKEAPPGGGVVWARQQTPPGRANRELEQPPWHRAEAVNDTAIRTACQRYFATPLEMRPNKPDGDSVCRVCEGKAPPDRLSTLTDAY